MRVVLETYIFLYSIQDNKWCSLKKLNFLNKTKKFGMEGANTYHKTFFNFFCFKTHNYWVSIAYQWMTNIHPQFKNIKQYIVKFNEWKYQFEMISHNSNWALRIQMSKYLDVHKQTNNPILRHEHKLIKEPC